MADYDLRGNPLDEEQLKLIQRGEELLREEEEVIAAEKEAALLAEQAEERKSGYSSRKETLRDDIEDLAFKIEKLALDFREYLITSGEEESDDGDEEELEESGTDHETEESGETAGEGGDGEDTSGGDGGEFGNDEFTLYLLEEISREAAEANARHAVDTYSVLFRDTSAKASAFTMGRDDSGDGQPLEEETQEVFQEISIYAEQGINTVEELKELENAGEEGGDDFSGQVEEQLRKAEKLRASLEERRAALIRLYEYADLDRCELDGTGTFRDQTVQDLQDIAGRGSFDDIIDRIAAVMRNNAQEQKSIFDRAEFRAVQIFIHNLWTAADEKLDPANEQILSGLITEAGRTDTRAMEPDLAAAYEKAFSELVNVEGVWDVVTGDGTGAAAFIEACLDTGNRLKEFYGTDNEELLGMERLHIRAVRSLENFRGFVSGLAAAAKEVLDELNSFTKKVESTNSESYVNLRSAVEQIARTGDDTAPGVVRALLEELREAAGDYLETHSKSPILRRKGTLAYFRVDEAEKLLATTEMYLGAEDEPAEDMPAEADSEEKPAGNSAEDISAGDKSAGDRAKTAESSAEGSPAEGGSAENSSAEAGNLGLLEEALTIRVKGAAVGRLEEDSSLSGQIRLHEKQLEVVRLEKARRIASGKLEDIPDETDDDGGKKDSGDVLREGVRVISFEDLAKKLNGGVLPDTGKTKNRRNRRAEARSASEEAEAETETETAPRSEEEEESASESAAETASVPEEEQEDSDTDAEDGIYDGYSDLNDFLKTLRVDLDDDEDEPDEDDDDDSSPGE